MAGFFTLETAPCELKSLDPLHTISTVHCTQWPLPELRMDISPQTNIAQLEGTIINLTEKIVTGKQTIDGWTN